MSQDSNSAKPVQTPVSSFAELMIAQAQNSVGRPGATVSISNANTTGAGGSTSVHASQEGTAVMTDSTTGSLSTATTDASKQGRAFLVGLTAADQASATVSATGKDAVAASTKDDVKTGASLNVVADAYNKIKKIDLTAQKQAELRKELEALKTQHKLSEEKLNSIITEVTRVNNTLAEQKEAKVAEAAALKEIQDSPPLTRYYIEARKIRYQFLVANLIMTNELQRTPDMADMVISGASLLGKHIPVVGVAASTAEQAALFANGIRKHSAMYNLSLWAPTLKMADDLAESFAIRLTLKRKDQINASEQHLKEQLEKHQARGVVEKVIAAGAAIYDGVSQLASAAGQKLREVKEGHEYTQEARLALADTMLVIKAIMQKNILPTASALASDRVLDEQVTTMLSVLDSPSPTAALSQQASFFSAALPSTGRSDRGQPAQPAADSGSPADQLLSKSTEGQKPSASWRDCCVML